MNNTRFVSCRRCNERVLPGAGIKIPDDIPVFLGSNSKSYLCPGCSRWVDLFMIEYRRAIIHCECIGQYITRIRPELVSYRQAGQLCEMHSQAVAWAELRSMLESAGLASAKITCAILAACKVEPPTTLQDFTCILKQARIISTQTKGIRENHEQLSVRY